MKIGQGYGQFGKDAAPVLQIACLVKMALGTKKIVLSAIAISGTCS
jgi:hypothetical protein